MAYASLMVRWFNLQKSIQDLTVLTFLHTVTLDDHRLGHSLMATYLQHLLALPSPHLT